MLLAKHGDVRTACKYLRICEFIPMHVSVTADGLLKFYSQKNTHRLSNDLIKHYTAYVVCNGKGSN